LVYGWAGKILYINLSTGKVVKKPSDEYVKAFIGARGVNAKLLYDLSKPGQSAFNPEIPIIYGTGALAGTGVIGASKMEITSRNPAEEPVQLYGNVGMGGSWAPELKFAGYDNVVITGRADKPTYIFIDNDDVMLKDAKGVWGKGTFETPTIIKEEVDDPDVKVVSIGPAGEKLVRAATIEHEYRSGTAMGAVMGAKNLKAVAVRGTKPIKVHDPEKILDLTLKAIEMIGEDRKLTGGTFDLLLDQGDAGMYFKKMEIGVVGQFESFEWRLRPDVEKAYLNTSVQKFQTDRNWGCFGCPFPCLPMVDVPEIGAAVFRCYPLFWPWQMWIADMKVAFEGTRLMSDYGLENREVAHDVAWLMRMYRDGVITAKDTDGIAFERGSVEAFMTTIEKIAKREGFGDVLADGPLKFAQKIGKKAEDYLIHRMGITPRTKEYRVDVGTALGYAINSRGNSHRANAAVVWEKYAEKPMEKKAVQMMYDLAKKMFGTEKAAIPWEYDGKAANIIHSMHHHTIPDILGLCAQSSSRPGVNMADISKGFDYAATVFSSATGIKMEEKQFWRIAEAIINVERCFQVREGVTRKDDYVPDFFFDVPVADGPQKGRKLDRKQFEKMKDEYYQLRGWDVATGVPTRAKLGELGLKDIANNLNKYGKLPQPQKKA